MRLARIFFFSLVFLILIPVLVLPSFADNSYLNSTITSLKPFTASVKSVPIFYPIFFLIAILLLTCYGLKNRADKIGMIGTIASAVMCVLLSLFFISPYDFTFTSNISQVTVEQSQLSGGLVNSTSIVKTSNEAVIIPHDKQFSLVLSSFFTVFGLLNGLLTILILTKWS